MLGFHGCPALPEAVGGERGSEEGRSPPYPCFCPAGKGECSRLRGRGRTPRWRWQGRRRRGLLPGWFWNALGSASGSKSVPGLCLGTPGGKQWGRWPVHTFPWVPQLASSPLPELGPHAHLTEVVQDLQDGEQAGPDEQPHLAPNVTCGDRVTGQLTATCSVHPSPAAPQAPCTYPAAPTPHRPSSAPLSRS